jgi:hypothetical protein
MSDSEITLQVKGGGCHLKQEGDYLFVDDLQREKLHRPHRISISLFHRIALFTDERRSYKNVMREFFDELQKQNIEGFFASRESLERATMAVGRPGGRIAFLLGMFCRYYGKLPRNVNMVQQACERCNNNKNCGSHTKCGPYYGCGEGVTVPLAPGFDIKTIPELRKRIKNEEFLYPGTG